MEHTKTRLYRLATLTSDMKELIAILFTERRSLLRGFLVALLLVLPFTFLPTIIKSGFSMYAVQQRLPDSLLYSALSAAAVILVALLNNYEKLLHKKRLYDFPAFAALDFYGGIEGYNSLIKELSTYLVGKAGNYYFRIDILRPTHKDFKIEVSPLINVGNDSTLVHRLVSDLKLQENLYLSRILSFSEEQLQDKGILRAELIKLSDELTHLGVPPAEINEETLASGL